MNPSVEEARFPALPVDVLDAVPAAGGLPLPTEAELAQTHAAAMAVLADLHQRALPAATLRALKTVLRYWALWHRAVYGTELELLRAPPVPVPGAKVLVFIAHHAAVLGKHPDTGEPQIRTGMPDHVRHRLALLEATEGVQLAGRRRVARRAEHQRQLHGDLPAIEADVPALKTVQQRVSLLGTLHTLRGLPPPQDTDGRIRPQLVALGKAIRNTTQVALPLPKQAIEADEFQRLLDACHPAGAVITLEGKRDQALLLATYGSGRRRSEVARLRQEHLRLGWMELSGGERVQGYWWDLYELKGRRSEQLGKPVLSVPLVGAAAEAMDAWLDVLKAAGHTTGPVWRTVYRARLTKAERAAGEPEREVLGVPIKAEVVAMIVKRRAGEALLAERPDLQDDRRDDEEERSRKQAERDRLCTEYAERLGAHSLRSGFSTSQIKAGVSAYDVMKMTGHTSLSSFRLYDQSGNENNPTLPNLMGFRL